MQQKFGLQIDAKVKGANNIRRLGNDMQGVQGKVKNLGSAVGSLGMAFKALFATAAVAGFASLIKGAVDQADAMGKLSTRTGIAADKLQAFVNAGKLADVSQEQLTSGLRVFARTQAEAADGVATYADAYGKLGVTVTKQDGTLKASDQLLGEIADRFADLPDGPAKAAVAMDIFGRSGAQMITLLNGGSSALEEFNYELSDNFAANAQYFNDLITQIGIKFEGFRLQLMDAVMPALIEIAQVFGELFATENDWSSLFTVISVGMRGISIVLLSMVKLVDELIRYWGALGSAIKAVLSGDFQSAADIAMQFGTDVVKRFEENVKQFERLAYGMGSAPDGYQPLTGGTDFAPVSASAGGSAAAVGTSSNSAAGSSSNALDGQYKALDIEQELLEIAQLRLEDTQRLFEIEQQSDELKRLSLEFEREREKIYQSHSESMKGVVSEERAQIGVKQLNLDLQRLNNQEQIQTEALIKQTTQTANTFGESFGAALKDMGNLTENLGSALGSAFNGAADILTEFVMTGKAEFGDFAQYVIAELTKIFIKFAMFETVKSFIPGLSEGGIFTSSGGLLPFAKGGVFAANGIVPFARGGVVNKPTLFPFASGVGLMGEAGPEAIMPLKRGPGGRLGVEAQGGDMGSVVVNVDAKGTEAQGDSAKARQLGDALGAAVRAELLRQKRPGGLLS